MPEPSRRTENENRISSIESISYFCGNGNVGCSFFMPYRSGRFDHNGDSGSSCHNDHLIFGSALFYH